MKRMKLLFTLALPVVLLQNAQGQTSRLISQAHKASDGVIYLPKDTTQYTYTNPRGGNLRDGLKFDRAYNWLNSDSLTNNVLTTQDFYADNSLKSSTIQKWNLLSMTWENSTRTNYWYNTDGTLSYTIYQTWGGTSWTNISKEMYSYSGGHLTRNEYQVWNGVSFDARSAKVYYYDASNNVSQVQNISKESGTWTYTSIFEYTYVNTNWVSTTKFSNYSGAFTTVPVYLYTNTYDSASGNLQTTVYQTYDTSSNSWVNNTLHIYGAPFTSAHQPANEIDQVWRVDTASGGSWVNSKKYDYTYDAMNNMTISEGISWNIAGFWQNVSGDPKETYHYELYSGVGVQNIAANAGNVTLSPVPAQSLLSVNISWKDAQDFTVGIYSINGVLINTWSVASTNAYQLTVPVDAMPSGNYFVKVSGAKGNITKQFSVAH